MDGNRLDLSRVSRRTGTPVPAVLNGGKQDEQDRARAVRQNPLPIWPYGRGVVSIGARSRRTGATLVHAAGRNGLEGGGCVGRARLPRPAVAGASKVPGMTPVPSTTMSGCCRPDG